MKRFVAARHLLNSWTRVVLQSARKFWHPPDLQRSIEITRVPDLKAAYEWAGDYVPSRNGELYDAILDYAKDMYKEIVRVSEDLDKKADDLMKISGAIGAALAAAGRVAGIRDVLTTFPILAAISSLIGTMLICARARKPITTVVPMSIETALEVAEMSRLPLIVEDGDEPMQQPIQDGTSRALPRMVKPSPTQVKATLAASYHWAVAGTQYVANWKARLITVANLIFCLAVTLLVVGFLEPLFWK